MTILFLCPHNAAKSVIAAALFNRLAAARGLTFTATSAGTEPSEAVTPATLALLSTDGIDVSAHRPRHVTPEDIRAARRIVSLGCTPQEIGVEPAQVTLWPDVPLVSQAPDRAYAIILSHIHALVDELDGSA